MHSFTTLGASQSGVARTPEADDDVVLGGLDTHQLRNAVQRRLFGGVVDPVRIGRFPILRRLGRGGMGVVFAAYDNELDRKIAIKLLHGGTHADDDENARARLLREAKALARLSHPSVVQVYEAGEHEGRVYLAMEFVEGVTLREWTERERIPTAEILAKYADAGRGLAAAHAAGLVHRDFKPDNAIVGADGRVRVLDFGLALATVDRIEDLDAASPGKCDDPRLTRTGALLGTPLYMAPEQFLGKPTDARTDQFSFAIALFEALFGERPFPGDSVPALSEAVVHGRLRMSSTRRVPKHVVRALRRALASRPDDRFPTMDALVVELERTRSLARPLIAVGVSLTTLGFGINVLFDDSGRELTAQVESERTRADEAERELAEQARSGLLSEASLLVHRDPTRAMQMLATLDADDEGWAGAAWDIAATAMDAGVASVVVPVADGWEGGRLLDDDTVLLHRPGGPEAIWHPDTGEIELVPESGHEIASDGRFVLRREPDRVLMHDRRDGTDHLLIDRPCAMATMWGGQRVHAMCETDQLSLERLPPTLYRWSVDADGRFTFAPLVIDDDTTPFGEPIVRLPGTRLDPVAVSTDLDTVAALDDGLLWIQHRQTGETWSVEIGAHRATASFSPDARWLAVVSSGTALLVSATERKVPVQRITSLAEVRTLAWAKDSARLHAIGKDDTIALWDVEGRRTIAELRGLDGVLDARWRSDGVFEAINARELRRFHSVPHDRIADDVLSVDARAGRRATLLVDGRIVRVDADGSERELPRHEGAVELLLGPDGSVITSAPRHLRLTGADGTTSELARTRDQIVQEMAVDATGERFAWLDEGRVHSMHLATRQRRDLAPHDDNFWEDLAFDPESGELWLIEDPYGDEVDLLRRVQPDTLATIAEHRLPEGQHTAIAALPGGRLALATSKGTIEIADVHSGEVTQLTGEGEHIVRLAASRDGLLLAASRVDETVDLWNAKTGHGHVVPAEPSGNALPASARPLSPSRRLLAFVADDTLLEVDTMHRLQSYRVVLPLEPDQLRAWVNGATTTVVPVR